MRAQLSPHSTISIPSNLPSKPRNRPFAVRSSSGHHNHPTTPSPPLAATRHSIGNSQPPWIVPVPSYNGSSGPGPVFISNSPVCTNGIPISLRLLQLRKKRENAALVDSAALGPVGNAVWSLACAIESLQKWTLSEDNDLRVASDSKYSTVWLFRRVYCSSPGMVMGLIGMTADFLVKELDGSVSDIGGVILEKEEKGGGTEVEERRGYECWSDIGILEEEENVGESDASLSYRRKKMAYEKMIVDEKRRDSVVLSNYAQLLYQYEKDFDR